MAGACGAPCRAKPCRFGQPCAANGDCGSGRCTNAHCAAPASCANQIKDGRETDVDCGGGDCLPCSGTKACQSRDDCELVRCLNGRCAHCGDGRRNGDESDVDCGGSCGPCRAGQGCGGDADCAGGTCQQGRCATCSDGFKNQGERDVDCGGACVRCGLGKRCNAASDCLSGACAQGLCAPGRLRTSLSHGDLLRPGAVPLRCQLLLRLLRRLRELPSNGGR